MNYFLAGMVTVVLARIFYGMAVELLRSFVTQVIRDRDEMKTSMRWTEQDLVMFIEDMYPQLKKK